MSMIPQDEEIHAQLMQAFRKYFEANQRWISESSKRAGMDTRYWLLEIQKLCKQRRDLIMEWRRLRNIEMAEQKARRRSQKQQAAGTKDTN
jgi:hypothetical protein